MLPRGETENNLSHINALHFAVGKMVYIINNIVISTLVLLDTQKIKIKNKISMHSENNRKQV